MPQAPPSRRRWFQFRISTLLVLTGILAWAMATPLAKEWVKRMGDKPLPPSSTRPPKGLEFLMPYPKLHGLSLNMSEWEFLQIVKKQNLKTRKTLQGETVSFPIALGDGHTLIVMFRPDGTCSGIQRVRGEDTAPEDSSMRYPAAALAVFIAWKAAWAIKARRAQRRAEPPATQ
jgi:hypothetical protein